MLPRFWPNPFYKHQVGTILLGLCLSIHSSAQTTPLATPKKLEYPGIVQTFEKILQINQTKLKNATNTALQGGRALPTNATQIELEPTFLNTIILHSPAHYLKLASVNRCRFYDTIITDLLKGNEGKIQNILLTYQANENSRQIALVNRKEFLDSVVAKECPEVKSVIAQFQIKTLDKTLQNTLFSTPNDRNQCRTLHQSWLNNPQTPYLCQIYEYIEDQSSQEALKKVLTKKVTTLQLDYIRNICENLDKEDAFCDEFLNVSFWHKISRDQAPKVYAESLCQQVLGVAQPTPLQFKQCLSRLKQEQDLCHHPAGIFTALAPQLNCESLSVALNHSSLKSDYLDCPGQSDFLTATNITRLLLHLSQGKVQSFQGPCSVISAAETFKFNQTFDNDEAWRIEACYDNKITNKEVCAKTFFGEYEKHPRSYPQVVANILKNTRGADSSLTCKMVDSTEYNPLLLEFKSGCHIIYESNKCQITQCEHRIVYNDRPIEFIKIKGHLNLEYFPLSLANERYTQHYLLTHDLKKPANILNSLSAIERFFKKTKKGPIYGIGCAEHLIPTFVKSRAINQCSPLPFIIDGHIKNKTGEAFVTRTAADSLQAPRLVSWSDIYSALKTYQQYHPLNLWTLYGLD